MILQQAKLPIVSTETCRRKYGSMIDSRSHLCAGKGQADTSGSCQGDSGGPLACEMSGRWYLHGVVSFGIKGCYTTHYSVFARTATFKQWIESEIGEWKGQIAVIFPTLIWKCIKIGTCISAGYQITTHG